MTESSFQHHILIGGDIFFRICNKFVNCNLCSDCLVIGIKLLIVDNDPRKWSHICSVPNIDPSQTPFLEFNIIKEDIACFGDKSYPISIHHFTKKINLILIYYLVRVFSKFYLEKSRNMLSIIFFISLTLTSVQQKLQTI